MSIQCEVVQERNTSNLPAFLSRLEQARTAIVQLYATWAYQRRITRSRRALEALPEHILHDIGWPNVDDRLPGIPKKPS
ncbi:hypothetical protein CES85_1469 [Ochrobactrum quorumnocens]|uniref:DUF1127 domain-containing protein n=1 Tax=Ochrobactrum quorumnocens TaxID=271865 RepID=A0A248UFV0_9HYPH|nr:DUF1127 domain-containing protein [[Ochrobactrum] quorumnocens]ASV85703.1 hypothetical protein CES85_1469 [[Ochrobactrum] quorumnocens]